MAVEPAASNEEVMRVTAATGMERQPRELRGGTEEEDAPIAETMSSAAGGQTADADAAEGHSQLAKPISPTPMAGGSSAVESAAGVRIAVTTSTAAPGEIADTDAVECQSQLEKPISPTLMAGGSSDADAPEGQPKSVKAIIIL